MPTDRPTVWNPGSATPNKHNLKHGLTECIAKADGQAEKFLQTTYRHFCWPQTFLVAHFIMQLQLLIAISLCSDHCPWDMFKIYMKKTNFEYFFLGIYFGNKWNLLNSKCHLMMGPALRVKDYSYLNKRKKGKVWNLFQFFYDRVWHTCWNQSKIA